MIIMGRWSYLPTENQKIIMKIENKLRFSTIHLGGKKVATFQLYVKVSLKASCSTNQPSNAFHLVACM